MELHTQNNNGHYDLSAETRTVEKQLYRTAPVQNSGDFGPFYIGLLKIGLNTPICLKLVNRGYRSRRHKGKRVRVVSVTFAVTIGVTLAGVLTSALMSAPSSAFALMSMLVLVEERVAPIFATRIHFFVLFVFSDLQ